MVKRIYFLLLLLVTSCQIAAGDLPTSTALPTPVALIVSHTPAVRPALPALQVCARFHPEIALVVNEIPISSPSLGDTDMIIHLGPEPRSMQFAIPLAWEDIAAIVHQENPVNLLEKEQLQAIFTGSTRQWSELQPPENQTGLVVDAWGYPVGNEVRELFDETIFSDKTPANLIFRLAPDPQAMIDAVGRSPGAIGYVPKAWLSTETDIPSVKEVRPFSISVPLLATTNSVVGGAARKVLECLQGGQGQETLMESYRPWESR